METLVTFGALLVVVAVKLVFFFLYSRQSAKNVAKKAEPLVTVQQGQQADGKAKRSVLVTGGCGFLGSAIVRHLHDRLGDRVRIIVIDVTVNDRFGALLPSVTYYRGDICTFSHIRTATAGCACVVHNAALLSDALTDDATVERVIYQGTRNVVEASLERDVRSLVYTSSASVTFPKSSAAAALPSVTPEPLLETAKPLPVEDLNGAYARAKAAAERFVLSANSHVLHVLVLRPGGLYGINDPCLCKAILAGKPCAGKPDAVTPFVWVEDAARAHVDAVEQLMFPAPDGKRIHGRAYHLCHDPVRDPFSYGEFSGGPLATSLSGAKAAAVRAAEAAAGVEKPPEGINAYGLPYNTILPALPIVLLSYVNRWVGKVFGVVLIERTLTPENMRFCMCSWPCDVSDARELLGWEPTPWRVVAARLGQEAATARPFKAPSKAGKVKAKAA